MKKPVTLYNVIIPIWLLFMFPPVWPVILAGNFGIDSLVLYLGMRWLGLADKKAFYKKHILKIWGCGFLGDLPGVLLMTLPMLLDGWLWNPALPREAQGAAYLFASEKLGAVMMNPFANIWSFLWATFAVAVSALCLYWLNYKLCYRDSGLEEGQKTRLALLMALVTAPWTFYLPTQWFYY